MENARPLYSKEVPIKGGGNVLMVFIDTCPLIPEFHSSEQYRPWVQDHDSSVKIAKVPAFACVMYFGTFRCNILLYSILLTIFSPFKRPVADRAGFGWKVFFFCSFHFYATKQ